MALQRTKPDGAAELVLDVAEMPAGGRQLGELRDAIEKLAKKHELWRARLAVTLDGDYCVTRVTTGTAVEVEHELKQLESRTQRYLSLGPGEKVTGGYRQTLNQRSEYAVTGVANRMVLEHIRETLREQNLSPISVEPTMVAVSRLLTTERVGESPVLLADGSGTQWDVGIAHDGNLLLDYRPSATRQSDRFGDVLLGHLARLNRFCERHRQLDASTLQDLYLIGPVEKVEGARKIIEQGNANLMVHTLCVQGFVEDILDEKLGSDPCWMGAFVALKTAASHSKDVKTANLLSSMRDVRKRSLRYHIACTLGVAATAAALLLTLHSRVDQQRSRIEELGLWQVSAGEESLKLEAIIAESAEQQTLVSALRGIEDEILNSSVAPRIVQQLPKILPNSVCLRRLQIDSKGELNLLGTTLNDQVIYDVTRAVKSLPDVDDASLVGSDPINNGNVDQTEFEIAAELVSKRGK